MNRTDRLYALVEDLRAIAPRRRSASELARRFEVSVRTIERDIAALQESGVPIYSEPGRAGGYAIDKNVSLPPLNFTPAEAVAIALALSRAGDQPFGRQARSALRKVVAAMPGREGELARELARRVRVVSPPPPPEGEARPLGAEGVSRAIEEALLRRRVLRLDYADAKGALTSREVEPGVFLGGRGGFWYLVGWCRLRDDVRVFRLDRIVSAAVLAERCPERPIEGFATGVPEAVMQGTLLD
ncbi:helix-turn-helix transcriptional regulator [Nonomuraea pusilla]|uniref:Predicted DNA-binding transcriptional regulator YafY, contains an HTH and WYL domains n=1 Tax=Nonomuraea pusilla TaxID=46177 RepID=A0A1H7YXL8_9ACTN|nr:YafY family protein [Nonomuraea pusilla]SEM50128.1 Predicted DNA-binding transcriptional regulator YafY, contains an HTH and WYL domains [Nonomuraea pusilla]